MAVGISAAAYPDAVDVPIACGGVRIEPRHLILTGASPREVFDKYGIL